MAFWEKQWPNKFILNLTDPLNIHFLCRYGGQAANFTADDLTQSPGEQDFDLQDLMRKLSTTDKPPDKEESQKSDQATVQEDGDNTGKSFGF